MAGTGLLLLNYLFPYRVDLAVRVYESLLVNSAEAILGILFFVALSRQIELRARRLGALLKYIGALSLIILLFHVPIQEFWGQKVMGLTNNLPLSILIGFIMGVLGPIVIHELFIRYNPVASFWFGRTADAPGPGLPRTEDERITAPAPGSPAIDMEEQ